MLDKPSGEQLLRAVVRFLREEVMPSLDGAIGFKTRVAANALELVGREIASRDNMAAAETARLVALLGHEGTLDELNRELCASIRQGKATLATPGLSRHLWQSTLDKLAVEQPGYASYRRVIEERQGGRGQ